MTRELVTARERDRWMAEIAGAQWGTIAWWQIRAAGIPRHVIDTRLARKRLQIVFRGVYAFGHAVLGREGRWMAAVLAVGPGAVLSHVSAAVHWGLLAERGGAIHVSVADRRRKSRRDPIVVHRPGHVEPAVHRGIPVTSVATTLVDLAARVQRPTLERAIERAEALRIFDLDAVRRAAGARRSTALAAALADYDDAPTKEEFERRFLQFCRQRGFPRPQCNAQVAGLEVDFVWPLHRLVVEADSRRFHGTWQAAERDRERDATLALAGYRTQRFTWKQLVHGPDRVDAVLRKLMGG